MPNPQEHALNAYITMPCNPTRWNRPGITQLDSCRLVHGDWLQIDGRDPYLLDLARTCIRLHLLDMEVVYRLGDILRDTNKYEKRTWRQLLWVDFTRGPALGYIGVNCNCTTSWMEDRAKAVFMAELEAWSKQAI